MLNSQLSQYTNEQLSRYTNRQLSLLPSLNHVIDRTSADVERWRFLRDKGWSAMTEDERKEWMGEIVPTPAASKGMYTHNDLNRVEAAVENLVGRLSSLGYDFSNVVIKTDWSYGDGQPTIADMERYFSNIRRLRECFIVYPDTPPAPSIDRKLDYQIANDIERILYDVDEIINKGNASWYYTGEVFSGEV